MAGLFISLAAQAQKLEVGGGVGGMLYKGDVSTHLNPRFYKPAANMFLRYNATRSFSLRGGLAIGGIRGEDRFSRDPFQQARDFSFNSRISEATIDLEYNFLNYIPQPKVKNWTPYVFGGIGLYSVRNAVIRARGFVNFPLGIGVKYEINRPWSVGLELGTRFTNSDYLDALGERTFGVTSAKRAQGNPALKDSYTYTAITFSYTFYRLVCP
ncbi:outer membrane beta-barrel protein [Spirosoma taeanense]|uniref:Outer membrane beta-barrel protein n=1 Tax=Spirosoma taeanense TaxID=2735870 RepID=A0A6M5YE37_9BACT|nr:outer membrane beta-barrel protein [Spirosoma taeanense]